MRLLLLVTAVLLLGGCLASGTQPGPATPSPLREGSSAVLRVTNGTFADFNIYLSWNSARTRLGRSRANSEEYFPIPESVVGEGGRRLRFLAEPIGARVTGVTREFSVLKGDTVFVNIPPN